MMYCLDVSFFCYEMSAVSSKLQLDRWSIRWERRVCGAGRVQTYNQLPPKYWQRNLSADDKLLCKSDLQLIRLRREHLLVCKCAISAVLKRAITVCSGH